MKYSIAQLPNTTAIAISYQKFQPSLLPEDMELVRTIPALNNHRTVVIE